MQFPYSSSDLGRDRETRASGQPFSSSVLQDKDCIKHLISAVLATTLIIAHFSPTHAAAIAQPISAAPAITAEQVTQLLLPNLPRRDDAGKIEVVQSRYEATQVATPPQPASHVSTSQRSNKNSDNHGSVRDLAYSLTVATFGQDQWPSMQSLIMSESNFNTSAINKSSGAYGIPQSLPGSKMASAGSDWRTNPETQIRWMLSYIKNSYGTPRAAWTFHLVHHWY